MVKRTFLAIVFGLISTWAQADYSGPPNPLTMATTRGSLRETCAIGGAAFYDDFYRSDTSGGVVSAAPLGQAYNVYGPGGSSPPTTMHVGNNTLTSTPGTQESADYATQTMVAPVNMIGGTFGWTTNAGGASGNPLVTFLVSQANTPGTIINNLPLHFPISQTGFSLSYFTGGSETVIKSVTFPTALSTGVTYCANFWLDGTILHYSVAGIVGSLYFPSATNQGLGLYPTWELYYGASTNPLTLGYFASAWAGYVPPGFTRVSDLTAGSWSFNTTSWLDNSPNKITLTGTGSPTTTTGIIGNAVSLNGTTQYLSASDSAAIELNVGINDFTIGGWVNISSLPASGKVYTLISKGANSSTDIEYAAGINSSGQICFLVSPNGTVGSLQFPCSNTSVVGTGAWHFWTVTVSALGSSGTPNIITFYVDGVQQGVNTIGSGMYVSTGALQIGYSTLFAGYGYGGFLAGSLDEMFVIKSPIGHGGALSQAAIQNLYNNGVGQPYPFSGVGPN